MWERTLSLDAGLRLLASRHYSRQTPNSPQLAPPGKRLYFVTTDRRALWASSRQLFAAAHRRDAWVCTFFRNEGPALSSDLIRSAIAATVFLWGKPLARGFVTEVDPTKTRAKRDPGRCFRKAGFKPDGETKGGLVVLRLPAEAFPAAAAPIGELSLEGAA